jgi:CRP-like cAMP-binding protein
MNLETRLRATPFFAGLGDAHVQTLLGLATAAQFEPGDLLLRQHQTITHCHVLCEGTVRLDNCDMGGRCTPVQTLPPGSVLGWSWLVPPYHAYFDARALGPVTTVALDATRLRAAMEADHDFGYAVLQRALPVLLSRLQSCRLQMTDVYAHPDARGDAPRP